VEYGNRSGRVSPSPTRVLDYPKEDKIGSCKARSPPLRNSTIHLQPKLGPTLPNITDGRQQNWKRPRHKRLEYRHQAACLTLELSKQCIQSPKQQTEAHHDWYAVSIPPSGLVSIRHTMVGPQHNRTPQRDIHSWPSGRKVRCNIR